MKKFASLSLFLVALTFPLLAQTAKPAGYAQNYKFVSGVNGIAINAVGEVDAIDAIWTIAAGTEYLIGFNGNMYDAYAAAINDSGELAGQSELPSGVTHAALWTSPSTIQDLGSPLGGNSSGTAINNAGQVAGVSETTDGSTQHAFFWSQATGAVDVGTLSGDANSSASVFNNNGEIAGISLPSGNPFIWTLSAGIQPLPTFGSYTVINGINDSGQIVGLSTYPDGTQHAALWTPNGSIQDLGTLAPYYTYGSEAQFINAAGHIVGFAETQTRAHDIRYEGFFWTPEVGMVGIGGIAIPTALNSLDQVLGRGEDTCLWSPTLGLHPVASGAMGQIPGGFNDAGEFLAIQNKGGEHDYELVTPIMLTSVSSSQNPSIQGQSVTFTANVANPIIGNAPNGEQVTFKDGSKTIGTGTLSNGAATFTTSTLTAGTHNITATYVGDTNYYSEKSAKLQQVVNQ